MASGIDRSKLIMSEARNTLRAHRLSGEPGQTGSSEDTRRVTSNHLEARPNNWEFSDWQPSKSFDGSKRRKKAKANPERQREKDQEKEEAAQARSMSQFSTPQAERHKHTPATFPRTKYTVPSQRAALERIRQQITFSDLEDVSTDTERNIDSNIPIKRETLANSPNKMAASSIVANNDDKLSGDVGLDTNHIVTRLMEIRDYIKQAMSMMDTLHNTDNPNHDAEIGKLRKLIQHLREQERAYMTLLQQLLTLQDEDMLAERASSNVCNLDTAHAKGDYPTDDIMSVDLDIRSIASEATTEETQSSVSRPRIEDKLGMDGPPNNTVLADDSERRPNSLPEWDYVTEQPREGVVVRDPSEGGRVELDTLREQEQLLKRLVDQQEQLRALHGRQEALLALQKDAEQKLAKTKQPSSQQRASHGDDPSYGVRECGDVRELVGDGSLLLRRDRDNTRNSQSEGGEVDELWHIPQLEMTDGPSELEDKLEKLQAKKRHMNHILSELQNLRSHRYNELVKALRDESLANQLLPASSQSLAITGAPNDAPNVIVTRETGDELGTENTRAKLSKVRECLDQLGDLVYHYDTANTAVPDRVFNATSRMPDHSNLRASPHAQTPTAGSQAALPISRHSAPKGERREAREPPQRPDNDESCESLSHVSYPGDDPEIRLKVQRLNEAKERLRALRSIVATIDDPACLPSSSSRRDGSDEAVPSGANNNESERSGASIEVLSDGEMAMDSSARRDADACETSLMHRQLKELRQLEDERRRLQQLSNNLVSLGGNYPAVSPDYETGESKPKVERNNTEVTFAEQPEIQPSPVTVTFSSNDELFDKMRKQRILREELRQKKRELEALMKKERPRRAYAKNQDNQSDTVSTEALGMSVVSADATMATWGGSTTENLESITEDNDACGDEDNVNDADYGSDELGQAEEEEEENEQSGATYTIEEDVRQRRQARADGKRGTVKASGKPPYLHLHPRDEGPRVEGNRNRKFSADWRNPSSQSPKYRNKDDVKSSAKLQEQQHRENSLCQAVLNLSQTIQGYQGMAMMGPPPHLYPRAMPDPAQYQPSLMYRNPHDLPQQSLSDTQFVDRDSSMHSATNSAAFASFQYPSPHFYPPGGPYSNPYYFYNPTFHPSPHLAGPRMNNTSQTSPSSAYAKVNTADAGPGSSGGQSAMVAQHDRASQTETRPPSSLNRIFGEQHKQGRDNKDQSSHVKQGIKSARATASLPSQLQAPYHPNVRPGVISSAFCDGATNDNGVMSSIRGGIQAAQAAHRELDKGSGRRDTSTGLDLFDSLREPIYSEVAALIFQNESHPHFLIELFRDLQLLSTDLLRQKSLTALRGLLASQGLGNAPGDTHEQTCETVTITTSELTPSENQIPSDEDDYMCRVYQPCNNLNTTPSRERKAPVTLRNYIQKVPDDSTQSTPSSIFDNPFSSDALGDTVIRFDSTMSQLRELEKRDTEAAMSRDVNASLEAAAVSRSAALNLSPKHMNILMAEDDSESSASETPVMRVDNRRLEQQVQDIMTDIVPVLRENMENVCTSSLLSYIKNLILSLTYDKHAGDPPPPSHQLFHKQLASILHTTLAKYEGTKLRDGSDDLIDDLTEVLYNELAYLRLMSQHGEQQQPVKSSVDPSGVNPEAKDSSKLVSYETESEDDMSSTSTTTSLSEDDDNVRTVDTMTHAAGDNAQPMASDEAPTTVSSGTIVDADDKDEGAEVPYKNGFLELTIGETKPFTRIGSDEDDDEDDESLSADDPSETAVSRDAQKEQGGVNVAMDTDDDDGQPSYMEEARDAEDISPSNKVLGGGRYLSPTESQCGLGRESPTPRADVTRHAHAGRAASDESVTVSQSTASESLVNGNEEFEEITVADLPDRLMSYTEEEWEAKIHSESAEILPSGEIITATSSGEVAGSVTELHLPPC